MIKLVSLVIFFCLSHHVSLGQVIGHDSLVWHITSVEDEETHQILPDTSTLEVFPTQVKWVRKNATRTHTFNIESRSNTWADITLPGSEQFVVRTGSIAATITATCQYNGPFTFTLTLFANDANTPSRTLVLHATAYEKR